MGLLSISKPPTEPSIATPQPSPDGAYEAPNRNARAHCWKARDAFFECLERNAIIDSIKDAEGARVECGEEGKRFEKECASSWVTYFKQRRVMEFNKKQTLEKLKQEGARPMPANIPPPVINGGPTT